MASARKKFKSKKNLPPSEPALYAEFAAALLDGTVKASKLVEVRNGNRPLELEYDDPDGNGQARVKR